VVVPYLKELYLNSLGRTEKNHEKYQSGKPASAPRIVQVLPKMKHECSPLNRHIGATVLERGEIRNQNFNKISCMNSKQSPIGAN
jgi:hypothetical protein